MGRKEHRGRSSVASVEIERKDGGELGNAKVETFDERKPEKEERFIGEMGDLLETPFYSINKMIPQLRVEMAAADPRDWYVKWFFPNAEGGPLYVDHPRSKHDMTVCAKKAVIMEKLGLTYKLFRPDDAHRLQNANEAIGAGDAEQMSGVF